jgi:hypothetical protein
MDTRATLTQRRRLMTTGGWLSLLAATCLIDLHEEGPAAAHLRTAKQLAGEANQAEIAAWCLETQAWQVLTAGDYRRAASADRDGPARRGSGSCTGRDLVRAHRAVKLLAGPRSDPRCCRARRPRSKRP